MNSALFAEIALPVQQARGAYARPADGEQTRRNQIGIAARPQGHEFLRAYLYSENHSLGEWFQRSLVAVMKTKSSFCFRMSVRSANCTKKAKGGHYMNDMNSLSHTSWNCKYHIVFALKYRRKVFYGEKRREIGETLRTLCMWKKVKIVEAEVCVDHVHMLLEIPPKVSVSSSMGYLKEQSDDIREIPGTEIQA